MSNGVFGAIFSGDFLENMEFHTEFRRFFFKSLETDSKRFQMSKLTPL